MNPLHHAYVLKGWLLDKNPPVEVTAALEAIIGALGAEKVSLSPSPEMVAEAAALAESIVESALAPAPEPKPRRKNNMLPEARAAASERMRAMQARKRAEREGTAPQEAQPPGEAPAPLPDAAGAPRTKW